MSEKILYLKLPQVKEVSAAKVYLGQIAGLYCADKALAAKAAALKVTAFPEGKKAAYVGNVLDLVKQIEVLGSGIQVENVGEADFVVTYKPPGTPSRLYQWAKTGFVSAVSFCGAAFAIMTFNNDANVTNVFGKFYRLVMGTEAASPNLLDLSYSVGLALGILLFFNHFASWKLTVDPTPIEVEMRLYEENLNKTLIKNGGRKESGIDVS